MSNSPHRETMLAAGGRISCFRCQARSKRTGEQCRAPAVRDKLVCRFHGGKSTGPRSKAGLERCAAAKTTHGQDTNAMREAHRAAANRLRELEVLAGRLGLFGPRLSRIRR